MNTNSYLTESDGPEIQPSVILNFLIKRCNEIIQSENLKFPLVLHGLALSALATDEELAIRYRDILSSSSCSPAEMIHRAIEIFQLALERDLDCRSSQHPNGGCTEDREPDKKFCRQFMMTALREGRIMLEQSDYRFLRVFECLAWIALQRDAEWMAEFKMVRTSFKNDPENIVERGRDILRDALFRRKVQGQILPSK